MVPGRDGAVPVSGVSENLCPGRALAPGGRIAQRGGRVTAPTVRGAGRGAGLAPAGGGRVVRVRRRGRAGRARAGRTGSSATPGTPAGGACPGAGYGSGHGL